MEKVENRLIVLWLFQYENLRIWNALQNKQNNVVIPPVCSRLVEFLAKGPCDCLKLMHTEDSTRTWIEIYSRLLNREITSALETLSYKCSEPGGGKVPLMFALVSPCRRLLLSSTIWVGHWAGGILIVTPCHCSVQLWPVGEQLY